MDIGDFVTSTRTLIRIFVILLYVPVGVVCYWRLIPRMSPTAKRLASVMMVAQIIVIAISLEYRPESEFEAWLWNLHKELNIPNVLSSTQLALVGGFALITAWLARARSAWLRLYWVGIGLVFAYLGTDEFFDLAASLGLGSIRGQRFMMLGAAMVLATTLVALRSPRRAQLWHGCLLAGLSFIAMGGLVLDELPEICGNLGFLRIEGCLNFQTPEEVIEMLGGWLALVAMLGQFSDEIPTPQARVRRPLYALPALWILLLTHQSLIPDLELRLMARPASVQFESEVHLQGYRIESAEGAYNIRLFVAAHGWYYPGLGYSVHLVDQSSGESVASRDAYVDQRPVGRLLAPGGAHIYRQLMKVEIPPQAPANRALWVVLTLWREKDGEYVLQDILASDHRLLSDTQVILDELIIPSPSASSSADALAVFDNGFTLDAVDLPEYARAGEALSLPFAWLSEEQGREDYIQFLHLGHQESGTWWVYDQQPLGPRLPTRLWYSGLADSEIWQVPLPADLAPGRYTVYTGLYRSRDRERVPANDADGTPWLDARVPLGILTIEP